MAVLAQNELAAGDKDTAFNTLEDIESDTLTAKKMLDDLDL